MSVDTVYAVISNPAVGGMHLIFINQHELITGFI